MKERFSSDHRSTWRRRFLAIAQETEPAAGRREAPDAERGRRGAFLPPRTWRGVRMSCRV